VGPAPPSSSSRSPACGEGVRAAFLLRFFGAVGLGAFGVAVLAGLALLSLSSALPSLARAVLRNLLTWCLMAFGVQSGPGMAC